MNVHRKFYFLVVIVGLIVTACAPQAAAPAVTSIPATSIPTAVVPTNTAIPSPMPIASPSDPTPWTLVAVGDSIPFNSSEDCPGCTGFVERYAKSINEATGHPVKVQNLSQHNGLQIDKLLDELKTDTKQRDALANADIIVVSISHNDTAWNRNDDPCDGPSTDNIDWSKFNAACASAAADIFRPKFESLFSQVVALRNGKPTIFRTINVYNDWIGVSGGVDSPEGISATQDVLDAWNSMVCKAAQISGFICADIYHAFNGSDGLKPAPDLLASDTVHPSDKGNAVIAKVLTDLGFAPLVP